MVSLAYVSELRIFVRLINNLYFACYGKCKESSFCDISIYSQSPSEMSSCAGLLVLDIIDLASVLAYVSVPHSALNYLINLCISGRYLCFSMPYFSQLCVTCSMCSLTEITCV